MSVTSWKGWGCHRSWTAFAQPANQLVRFSFSIAIRAQLQDPVTTLAEDVLSFPMHNLTTALAKLEFLSIAVVGSTFELRTYTFRGDGALCRLDWTPGGTDARFTDNQHLAVRLVQALPTSIHLARNALGHLALDLEQLRRQRARRSSNKLCTPGLL